MVITLIGYRGCGKTSVARSLAERLGWDWVDADVAIESAAGKSISEIFESDGEKAFRELERITIQQLLESERLVLAAGGGAILNEKSREAMRNAGPVVWLKARAETLAARIEADALSSSQRPSLTGKSIGTEVAEVLAEREPAYADAATFFVDTEGSTIPQVVEAVQQQLIDLNLIASDIINPPHQ